MIMRASWPFRAPRYTYTQGLKAQLCSTNIDCIRMVKGRVHLNYHVSTSYEMHRRVEKQPRKTYDIKIIFSLFCSTVFSIANS